MGLESPGVSFPLVKIYLNQGPIVTDKADVLLTTYICTQVRTHAIPLEERWARKEVKSTAGGKNEFNQENQTRRKHATRSITLRLRIDR